MFRQIIIGTAALFGLASTAQVAPNFIAFNQNGLKVTLNQQFASNFDSTRVLITNAIGISFTNICSTVAASVAPSPLASRWLSSWTAVAIRCRNRPAGRRCWPVSASLVPLPAIAVH